MKYLLLDTNIYLNIAVNRRKDINYKLIKTLSKLLYHGEIRIILPAIVRHETFKHLENEISKIETNLESAKKSIEDIYWLNGIDQGTFNINYYKKNSKKYIQDAYDYFNKNKEDYIYKIENYIDSIFENERTISIEDNDILLNKALKRRIYKKAPCHKKDSYADAIIVEVLVNLRDYIDINNNDIVYFISDNPEDFSKSENEYKYILHPHIVKDLEENELDHLIQYRLNFAEFIMKDLSEEIENADVKEEFEREFEEEKAIEEATYYNYLEDMDREAGGLTSLSSFENKVYNEIVESEAVESLLKLFETINDIHIDLEELYGLYLEDIPNKVSVYMDEDQLNREELIGKFNKFLIENKLKNHFYNIEEIIEWLSEQENQIDFYDIRLPDYIDINEEIRIVNANQEAIILSWNNTELLPESGESHTIYCKLEKEGSNKTIAEGWIEIIYGFMEFDDSENAGDGCQDDITVRLGPIVEFVETLCIELGMLRDKHKIYMDYIRKI